MRGKTLSLISWKRPLRQKHASSHGPIAPAIRADLEQHCDLLRQLAVKRPNVATAIFKFIDIGAQDVGISSGHSRTKSTRTNHGFVRVWLRPRMIQSLLEHRWVSQEMQESYSEEYRQLAPHFSSTRAEAMRLQLLADGLAEMARR